MPGANMEGMKESSLKDNRASLQLPAVERVQRFSGVRYGIDSIARFDMRFI